MDYELYECRNCYHAGPLTIHGRCEACGSDSMISQEVLAITMAVSSDSRPLRPTDILGRMGAA